jgi:hypothetical protein
LDVAALIKTEMGVRMPQTGGALRELKPLPNCSGGLGFLCHACGVLTLICRRRNLLRVLRRGGAGTRVTGGGGGVSESAEDAAFQLGKGGAEPLLWLLRWYMSTGRWWDRRRRDMGRAEALR